VEEEEDCNPIVQPSTLSPGDEFFCELNLHSKAGRARADSLIGSYLMMEDEVLDKPIPTETGYFNMTPSPYVNGPSGDWNNFNRFWRGEF
jgi:hypothetical protein